MKENANSRRNMQVVGDMYARVMRALAEKEGKGESYPSLKEAPVERLPYLVEKFIQAARKSNMEVYASGTFHSIQDRKHIELKGDRPSERKDRCELSSRKGNPG